MRVAVICVNYGSNELAIKYLESLRKAIVAARGNITLDVILVDNTVPRLRQEEFYSKVSVFEFVSLIRAGKNLGYFGGVQLGFEKVATKDGHCPDWLIVSNVDVEVSPDFLEVLRSRDGTAGVLAPAIISRRSGSDRNPKMLQPLSQAKARLQLQIFRTYWLQNFYLQLGLLKSIIWKGHSSCIAAQEIYAGHGSFMIFSRVFLERGGHFKYSGFLFGEEVFVAEQARRLKLAVVYEPSLRVNDFDHASTGQWRSREVCRHAGNSAEFVLRVAANDEVSF